MQTAIVYYSKHHGNTKKLLDAIAQQWDVALIDAAGNPNPDLSEYDLIGFASGIYFGRFHKSVLKAAGNLPEGKKVFIICTYGAKKPRTASIEHVLRSRQARLLGTYGCRGFDTFGPFKLVGGIAKGHPNENDIAGAVKFFAGLLNGLS